MNKKVLVFTFVLIFLLICLVSNQFNYRRQIRYLNDKIVDKVALIDEISMKDRKAFENNGKKLLNEIITDTSGLNYSLSSNIKNRVVVFNFALTNCSQCYESILELLESYQDNNLIIIFNANNLRDLKFLGKDHKFQVRVFYSHISNKSFPSSLENLPCFFILDKDLEINNVYFPLKNETDYISEYLKINLRDI